MVDINKVFEYYLALYFDVNYGDVKYLNSSHPYDMNEVCCYLNQFWYDNFSEYLDLRDSTNKKRLLEFLNEIFRYPLLNDNLDEAYSLLTRGGKETYLMEHLDSFVEKAQLVLKTASSFRDSKDVDLPPMSMEELDSSFREFLIQMDPEGDYLSIYEDMVSRNKIVYLDEFHPDDKRKLKESMGIFDETYNNFFIASDSGAYFLFLEREGTIQDFRTLAHEFCHYVTYVNHPDDTSNPLLLEYPAIFYELMACKFLIDKGYDSLKVTNCYQSRLRDIASSYEAITCIQNYLKLFQDGLITLDRDYDYLSQSYMKYMEEKGSGMSNFKDLDFEQMVKNYCDVANMYLTRDPSLLARKYPYYIGQYLATHKLKESFKSDVLEEMKNITFHLPKYKLEDILELGNEKK